MEVIDLADDERHIRELMQAFLSQAGYEVHTFSNGDALMEACRREMPDLVILDIMMPGTDGLSVCTQLRQQNEHLPIIIVSAKDSPYDRVTGLTLGVNWFNALTVGVLGLPGLGLLLLVKWVLV